MLEDFDFSYLTICFNFALTITTDIRVPLSDSSVLPKLLASAFANSGSHFMLSASLSIVFIPAAALPDYEGGFRARCLALSGFVWLVYDHCLTFEQEVKYFWAGPFSTSKLLFLWNRYFSPVVLILGLACLFGTDLSDEFCSRALRTVFVTDYIGITVVQAIIVMRVWYILSGRLVARIVVLGIFVASIVISARNFATIFHSVGYVYPVPLPLGGCPAPPIVEVWTIFLPYLVTQSILFVATMLPAFHLHRQGRHSQVMSRLVRDGGVFYFAFFVAAVFTTIGSIQKGNMSLLYTAVFSNFLLAVSSVSVSRLILSIRSLASQLSIDPDTLLSTAELSRISWKRGARDGEIIVDINTVEDSYDMGDIENVVRPNTPGFYTTQVGVYDDIPIPGSAARARSFRVTHFVKTV
ncbi:uncharacterized protein B0H18DRAFT_1006471 [Fomitopsis serialis]|uniref:uncharacterized protein n=1 Tax=Fomitopsis serialis TaxID=139415 RepID=UPI00200797CD|nr:uncharacterized protein B0H18DRAFT_1006471 [Neoantrodia serialis]KAH9926507.1 hypothetical protein B0H18DRAFT_1006471 [Neoantrodia serialis]